MAPKDPLAPFFNAVLPNGAGDQHRTKLQRSAEQLGSDEIDPPYITTMESFEGWQHSEIYAKTQEMNPDDIGGLAQACHAIVGSLPIGFGFALLKNTIAEKWEGAAADAALAATDTLAGASDQLTSGVQAIGVKLDILSSAAQDVKNSIPAPMSEQPLSLLPLTPTAAEAQEAARDAAREEAIRKLQNIYVPNYQDVGTNVPVLPAPHSPNGRVDSVDPNVAAPSSGSPGSWGTTDSHTSSASGEGDLSADSENSADGNSAGDDAAATSAANAESAANQGAGAGSGSAAQTAAANAQNAAGTGSQSGSGAGAAGYGGGIGGGSGSGAGGSGLGGSASGARRKNDKRDSESSSSGVVPGGPIPSGGAAAGAGAAAAAAAATPVKPSMSRPGMGMAPGMMGAPGRAGGNGDGDTEHQTPSYLITVDNGNELIGKLDPVAPPVIGA
ncbi:MULTISPECIES: hypothetical protein [Rhodococcus]|uniref:hypothetical protein n=1 Tax=Rhodococcus TaxID=1827 RepID=UPI000EA88D24|nr:MULTISPECIES: hypothetical protein [Rhodococcus]NHU43299.1 hypothetical protein [Rhodococcus sp. A14]MDI9937693.1 hypothetical protein [Rhodococcus sp. IEGM 1351]QZS58468.1 hypothetical protein FXW36_16330 [Rhodococcus opacus]RKM74937.1 hypothetical protein COO55_24815 [Rhodococcus opacus]WKN54852.1 hypothetical protein HJ581_0014135 [Rhodococcus opacus]